MSYIKKTVKAGKTIEIWKYYSTMYRVKGIERAEKQKPTSEAQKKINRRHQEDRLRWLVNENFGTDDLHLVLTFRPDEKPKTRKELNDLVKAYLRKLRSEYRKAEKELKYVYVAEIGKKGAIHCHLIVNYIELKVITKGWTHGRVHTTPLDDSGQYKQLASYFIKEVEKTFPTGELVQKKCWSSSRNLRKPQITKEVISTKRAYKEDVKPVKGYYIEKDSIKKGIDPYSGYPYLHYTMIKLEEDKDEWFG